MEQAEQKLAAKVGDIEHWMRLIRKYAAVEELDREMLERLVEKIEVGEKLSTRMKRRQAIRIHYRFVGLIN